jgi:tripartite-type tricarboxylate transporter receptor subunit TctC
MRVRVRIRFRRLLRIPGGVLAAALVLACSVAFAQEYPAHPLKLIVPFPPGGPTDIVGRLVALRLGEALGQQVVVENRPGAGGTVGSELAAKAPADGYTLLYGSTSTLAMAPSLYPKLPYDPRRSFAPVSLVSTGPLIIAVNAAVPAATLREFIELARAHPHTLNYASAGNGTPPHLAAEYFKRLAGVDLVHVPYKGGGPGLQGVVAGEAQVLFEGQVTLGPQIRAGKLRALAITSQARDPGFPDVPTTAEAGLPAFQPAFWSGVVAPAGTPEALIARLNAALLRALGEDTMREGLARQGLHPAGSTPAAFARFIDAEIRRWTEVVAASGAQVD